MPIVHCLKEKNLTNPKVYLKAFGGNIKLNLWAAEGMLYGRHTPVYTVETDVSSPQGLRYTKYNEYGVSVIF